MAVICVSPLIVTLICEQYFLKVALLLRTEEEKILKNSFSPSLFHQPQLSTTPQSMLSKYSKKCDICDTFLVSRNKFSCKVTGKIYNVRGELSYDSVNVH